MREPNTRKKKSRIGAGIMGSSSETSSGSEESNEYSVSPDR